MLMPSANEVKTVIDKPYIDMLKRLSKRNGISVSRLIRDLVINSLEDLEEVIPDEIGAERLATLTEKSALSSRELRKKLGIK